MLDRSVIISENQDEQTLNTFPASLLEEVLLRAAVRYVLVALVNLAKRGDLEP